MEIPIEIEHNFHMTTFQETPQKQHINFLTKREVEQPSKKPQPPTSYKKPTFGRFGSMALDCSKYPISVVRTELRLPGGGNRF